MKHLDLAIRNLYAEFQESIFKRAQLERTSVQEETFVRKRVKGKEYWYKQSYVAGKAVQRYFGPANEANNQMIARQREEKRASQSFLRALLADEQKRSAMLRRGGLPHLDSITARLIERCSESLLIDEKGILIGSHAFAAYSGTFGCLFDHHSLRTLDIDIVPDENIKAVAGKEIDLHLLLRVGDKTVRAIPGLSLKTPSSSFIGPAGIRIDFLTPLKGKPKGVVKAHGILNAGTSPVRFLDFLVEEPVRSVLLGPRGGIPVTVPDPARFAVHKLIVSTCRPVTESAKRAKDIAQAAQLILVLAEERPADLASACREALKRGKKWKTAVLKGTHALPAEAAKKMKEICRLVV